MSAAKKSGAKTPLPSLALYGSDEADRQQYLEQVRDVRELQRQYAAAIIAAGIFNSNTCEHWIGILSVLAERDAAATAQALTGLFDRLEAASPDSTRIPFPTPDNPTGEERAADVLTTHACSWGEVGFRLGLAVGMQLGPHAFDGGAK